MFSMKMQNVLIWKHVSEFVFEISVENAKVGRFKDHCRETEGSLS